MKITIDSQQTVPAGETSDRTSAAKGPETARRQAAKAPPRRDSVQLSDALHAELGTRESEQAERVEALKARVAAGEYQVDARAVAEKILSGRSDS
jgi:negative regulator of flagellin synthesis FlgM